MQAIILAAGMGRRLKELTENNTKCMVEVNGQKLIDRVLHQLDHFHFSKIVLVIGYQGENLKEYVQSVDIHTPVVYISNPDYDKTNNIYSLYLAKDYLTAEDTLLLESDLIFEDRVLEKIMEDKRDTLALVARYEDWMDGTCLMLDGEDHIVQFISGKYLNYSEKKNYYKTVNIYKFSKEFSKHYYLPFLEAYSKALGNNEYYEQVIKVLTILDNPGIQACRLSGEKWYEIDDIQDLDIASSMFAAPDDKLKKLQQRYGGYWRYPKLLDFCYLVNPYFPPAHMLEELKSNFEKLAAQYPSGMAVNAMLAGKLFGIRADHIVVGNGAAELIKSFMERMTGKIGLIRPTFEEYPNRYKKEDIVSMKPENQDFSYSAEDIIRFFEDKPIEWLFLINPDNPSGNYIEKREIIKLIQWAGHNKIKLIVDESFVDFAEEPDNTLLEQKILEENPHLTVVKSISKSYGVPGFRLGILASGDVSCIEQIKQDVSIWNINSFGEYFLQIAEKYSKDYQTALVHLRKERKRFASLFEKIPGLRIIPSQANYLMAEVLTGTSYELTKRLLDEKEILIKDLSKKVDGEYIRLAIRDEKDNDFLIAALREIMEQ